jgi:hypothetical protein
MQGEAPMWVAKERTACSPAGQIVRYPVTDSHITWYGRQGQGGAERGWNGMANLDKRLSNIVAVDKPKALRGLGQLGQPKGE